MRATIVAAVLTSDLTRPEPVEDVDVVGHGLVVGVDLARLEGGHGSRRIRAVVDELDAVEIGFAAPPRAVSRDA